jgi:hypothetical protein
MAEEHITEIPDEYFDKEASKEAHDQAMRQMVNQHPHIFPGERWDEYREKQEEGENENSRREV